MGFVNFIIEQLIKCIWQLWHLEGEVIGVIAFCLHGWCMLGVFFLPASTSLGHECEDLLSPCDGVYVCSTLIWKSFWGMESEPMWTLGGKSPLPEAQRRIEPTTLHHTGQQAQHATDWAILAPQSRKWDFLIQRRLLLEMQTFFFIECVLPGRLKMNVNFVNCKVCHFVEMIA